MSFLSKLFGEKGDKLANEIMGELKGAADQLDKAVKKSGIDDALGKAADELSDAGAKVTTSVSGAVKSAGTQQSAGTQVSQPAAVNTGSDASWGETMPAEENQFTYPGTYADYFNNVFTSEFPGYEISYATGYNSNSTVFTFMKEGYKALVVEILPESSCAKKLRNECKMNNIPYIRFYHNHDGWWNTRSYVTGRTRAALGM